ncbi:zinc finger protein [Actinoalloteichus hymeniacidonis]|uniref:Zinc-finger n=1 Tax=Actinoalloteichus hymeniacidonis TaxID=340345 RepID=A0AAC9HQ32_9PSEU|nr:zinc finger protein [Actinoalloteichus hymeniacidonis]AOS63236.1 hypothetical protein TL08_12110 [Actinoalloteichus hymeniacidonis]MBB5908725.1 hypothetical protein [Actinoalloteichus hymeniacidonis]
MSVYHWQPASNQRHVLRGPRRRYGDEETATALCDEVVVVASDDNGLARFWASCEKCWEAAKEIDMSATQRG